MPKTNAAPLVYLLLFSTLYIAVPVLFAGSVVQNGDMAIQTEPTPRRVVTMNQASTELMLALGLESYMVGTAYLDDVIHPNFAAAYAKIPVLSDKYPPKEVILDVDPDFVYAGYASAFSARRGLIERKELQAMGIRSYLNPAELLTKTTPWTIENLYQELRDIGKIFSVEKRANKVIEHIQQQMSVIDETSNNTCKPQILWLDHLSKDSPFVGTGYGTPNEIIRLAGGVNVFANVHGGWATVSKEQILDLAIDLIVTIDANWESAKKKKKLLRDDDLYGSIDAVYNSRFVQIDFSGSTPGIRVPQAVSQLHDAISQFCAQKSIGFD